MYPCKLYPKADFNPRSPHGERPAFCSAAALGAAFQPTLPARGATNQIRRELHHPHISTHAPRTGSDNQPGHDEWLARHFNPRSPHGERQRHAAADVCVAQFQPTLPARGATWTDSTCWATPSDFNPRSPHGERPDVITASAVSTTGFQPTLPARGATHTAGSNTNVKNISTHAPRTGSDAADADVRHLAHISTHAPRTGSDPVNIVRLFQIVSISTHAPRTGSDNGQREPFARHHEFQPTLPARGATLSNGLTQQQLAISTHAPRTGSDKRHL